MPAVDVAGTMRWLGGFVVLLLLVASGCGSPDPTGPTASSPLPSVPPATRSGGVTFPPLSGPSRTFLFGRELLHPVSGYTRASRFVLYDNGAFVLQFPSVGEGGYRGGYEQVNGVITFEWEGWNVAGPWGATGTLSGDVLTVRYNEIMLQTDFEDAVYVLTR
jgi:hypothetical protein